MSSAILSPENIRKICYHPKQKLACFTIDIEPDYGGRTETSELILSKNNLNHFTDTIRKSNIPISAFITTNLLLSSGNTLLENLRNANIIDFHCHSHTHPRYDKSLSSYEISESFKTFTKFLGTKEVIGYRAPQGIITSHEVDIIKNTGYHFSSSVFPSFRPGKFNNFKLPTTPFLYGNNLLEFPLATIKHLRIIFSLSYAKFLGIKPLLTTARAFGLPNIVIVDSHIHDFIADEHLIKKLPLWLRLVYSCNKYKGGEIFNQIIYYLKKQGYEFITMTELYKLYLSLNSTLSSL